MAAHQLLPDLLAVGPAQRRVAHRELLAALEPGAVVVEVGVGGEDGAAPRVGGHDLVAPLELLGGRAEGQAQHHEVHAAGGKLPVGRIVGVAVVAAVPGPVREPLHAEVPVVALAVDDAPLDAVVVARHRAPWHAGVVEDLHDLVHQPPLAVGVVIGHVAQVDGEHDVQPLRAVGDPLHLLAHQIGTDDGVVLGVGDEHDGEVAIDRLGQPGTLGGHRRRLGLLAAAQQAQQEQPPHGPILARPMHA